MAVGAVTGVWLGVADAWSTLWSAPALAGPLADRLGTFAIAMLLGALLLSPIGLAAAGLLGILPRNSKIHGMRRTWTHGGALVIAAALALLVASGVSGIGWEEPSADRDERPNIVIVSIDTLRADHLGAYGYARKTSPNIDALAAEVIEKKSSAVGFQVQRGLIGLECGVVSEIECIHRQLAPDDNERAFDAYPTLVDLPRVLM